MDDVDVLAGRRDLQIVRDGDGVIIHRVLADELALDADELRWLAQTGAVAALIAFERPDPTEPATPAGERPRFPSPPDQPPPAAFEPDIGSTPPRAEPADQPSLF